MKKGCLILFIFFIGIIVVPILIHIFFPEEPATPEKIAEVLDQEYQDINDFNNVNVYIELLDFLQIHKNEILNSFKEKEETECQHLFYVSDFYNYIELSDNLLTQFQDILSRESSVNPRILICANQRIVLRISE